jgi:hypothetical protein
VDYRAAVAALKNQQGPRRNRFIPPKKDKPS